MSANESQPDLRRLQRDIRRMAVNHRALLDEFERRLSTLDRHVTVARAGLGHPIV